MRMRFASVAALVVVSACGGGASAPSAPTVAPTPTPPPAPSFRDGWSEQSISAEITPAAPRVGDAVVVRAPSYLTREAPFRGEAFFLWPADEGYVTRVVYTRTDGVRVPLRRYDRTSLVITPEGDLKSDAAVLDVLARVAAEASRATGIPITVGPNGQVHVIVDPNQPDFVNNTAAAFTQNFVSANVIISSNLYFPEAKWITGASRTTYDNTALHEMGHAVGLFHSDDPKDIMFPGRFRENQEFVFSPRELVNLKLIYRYRRPGNAAPDRDPGLAPAGAAAPRMEVIID